MTSAQYRALQRQFQRQRPHTYRIGDFDSVASLKKLTSALESQCETFHLFPLFDGANPTSGALIEGDATGFTFDGIYVSQLVTRYWLPPGSAEVGEVFFRFFQAPEQAPDDAGGQYGSRQMWLTLRDRHCPPEKEFSGRIIFGAKGNGRWGFTIEITDSFAGDPSAKAIVDFWTRVGLPAKVVEFTPNPKRVPVRADIDVVDIPVIYENIDPDAIERSAASGRRESLRHNVTRGYFHFMLDFAKREPLLAQVERYGELLGKMLQALAPMELLDLTLSAEYGPDLEHLFPDPNGPDAQANVACVNDERWGARWTELRFFFFYLLNWAGLENLRKFAILQLRPTGFSEREQFRDHFRSKLALFSFEKGALGELWVKVRPSGYELFVDVTAPKVAKLIEAAIGRPLEKTEPYTW